MYTAWACIDKDGNILCTTHQESVKLAWENMEHVRIVKLSSLEGLI